MWNLHAVNIRTYFGKNIVFDIKWVSWCFLGCAWYTSQRLCHILQWISSETFRNYWKLYRVLEIGAFVDLRYNKKIRVLCSPGTSNDFVRMFHHNTGTSCNESSVKFWLKLSVLWWVHLLLSLITRCLTQGKRSSGSVKLKGKTTAFFYTMYDILQPEYCRSNVQLAYIDQHYSAASISFSARPANDSLFGGWLSWVFFSPLRLPSKFQDNC
jgi:hypothetical protein